MKTASAKLYHPPAFETPWVVTPELREREGPYADFVAWKGWMSERLSKSPATALDVWDTLDTLERIEFFSAMNDACRFAAEKAKPAPADLSEAGREGEETNG
jgi:hypothetical protein